MKTTIKAEKKYLNIPVNNEASQERVFVYVDGKIDYYFDLQLANKGEADFWVYMDIGRYAGCEITLKTTRDSATDPEAFNQLYQSDEPKEAASFYKEKKRPQLHFTSKRGWLNDPNGLVYYKGEYHLFYQHNPYGWKWGNMHWGHAVSKDLVHWAELGDALLSDELGTIYSGSAVVDWDNTSGFGSDGEPPIVAIYTAAGNHAPVEVPFTQCIAYSNDKGRTWNKYSGNPVLGHIRDSNRDPKVIWHEQSKKWIMALFIDGKDYSLFSSPDLKNWKKLSDFEGGYECPDFFPMMLDGNPDEIKWVFWTADGTYFLGSFDGTTFTPETGMKRCYDGGNVYAGQTFSDIPDSDGRRIHIPWLREPGKAFVGMRFNQQMGFPVEFTLRSTSQGAAIFTWPVQEIENIYAETHKFVNKTLSSENNLFDDFDDDMLDIYAEFEIEDNDAVFGFEIKGQRFVYDCKKSEIDAMGQVAHIAPQNGRINMRILVDRVSIEFFAGDGLVYMPFCLPSPEKESPRIFSEGGSSRLVTLVVNKLESIWD
ncbi:MAG: GH32 C-terminal domain-containing protein [Sedimentisphaeraceae bacterium JB056]